MVRQTIAALTEIIRDFPRMDIELRKERKKKI